MKLNRQADRFGIRRVFMLMVLCFMVCGIHNSISAEPVSGSKDKFIIHRVAQGETVFSIAQEYQISVQDIYLFNPRSKKRLKVGSKLKLSKQKIAEARAAIEARLKEEQENKQDILLDNQEDNNQEDNIEEVKEEASQFSYRVVAGDTYWNLNQRFGVSKERLMEINPVLDNGLNLGSRIMIPVVEKKRQVKVVPIDSSQFISRVVKSKETLYSIAIEYSMKIREIEELNPFLNNRGLLDGDTLLLRKKELVMAADSISSIDYNVNIDDYKVVITNSDNAVSLNGSSETYRVCLLLPLSIDISLASKEQINKSRFLSFYSGVLLALDSLKSMGANIELSVFDTKKDVAVIDYMIRNGELNNYQLIVGPVYNDLLKELVPKANSLNIGVVSPLSSNSDLLANYDNLFQVKPDASYSIEKSITYAINDYFTENFIVLTGGGNKAYKYAKQIKSGLEDIGANGAVSTPLYTEVGFEDYDTASLDSILSSDKENVIFLSSTDEIYINRAIGALSTLVDEYSITLLGLPDWSRYKSLDLKSLHLLNTKYLAPYYIDYRDQDVVNFISKYRYEFANEPSRYSFQGYDVMFYFGSALYSKGVTFNESLDEVNVKTLQSKFEFKKISEKGGYQNSTLYINSFTKEFVNISERLKIEH